MHRVHRAHFWDTMTPFYDRLPSLAGFGVENRVDLFGGALALGVTGGIAAHGLATVLHRRRGTTPLPVIEHPARLPVRDEAQGGAPSTEEDDHGSD